MSYTLIRECEIVLFYNGIGYHFDALSNFQFSQTFSRNTVSRKTLHSRNPNPHVVMGARPAGSFSMTVLATDTYSEGVFFELAGMVSDGRSFTYPTSLEKLAKKCEIYIINKNNTFRVSNAHIQNVDVGFSISSPLSFDVTFTGGSIDRVQDLALGSGLITQGEPLRPGPVQLYMQNRLYNNVISVATSLQQEISWREDRGMHDIGKLYVPKVAALTNMSLSTTVTTHLTSNISTPDEPFLGNVKINRSTLSYDLRNVLISKRFTTEDAFQEAFDIIPTSETQRVVVEYGGLLP